SNLGEHLVDQPFLATEVVKEHAWARPELLRKRTKAETREAVLENVVGGPGERCRAAVGVYRAGHFFYSRFINYRSVVIKLDAAFEAALGCALLAGGFGPADFPHPVGRVVVVVVA